MSINLGHFVTSHGRNSCSVKCDSTAVNECEKKSACEVKFEAESCGFEAKLTQCEAIRSQPEAECSASEVKPCESEAKSPAQSHSEVQHFATTECEIKCSTSNEYAKRTSKADYKSQDSAIADEEGMSL